MQIISLNNISKKFKEHTILEHFNLVVNEGEMIAITGKSGSGKTTVLNILGLIEAFNEGEYYFYDQKNVKIESKQAMLLIRNHINYLFQNFALIDEDSILDNLLIGLEFKNLSKTEKIEEIKATLTKVGIIHDIKTKVSALSGGEQQRVAIARIILKEGNLILADEPTGSLDNENKELVIKLLKQLNKEGKTIVIVTHDMSVAEQCDRVISL